MHHLIRYQKPLAQQITAKRHWERWYQPAVCPAWLGLNLDLDKVLLHILNGYRLYSHIRGLRHAFNFVRSSGLEANPIPNWVGLASGLDLNEIHSHFYSIFQRRAAAPVKNAPIWCICIYYAYFYPNWMSKIGCHLSNTITSVKHEMTFWRQFRSNLSSLEKPADILDSILCQFARLIQGVTLISILATFLHVFWTRFSVFLFS